VGGRVGYGSLGKTGEPCANHTRKGVPVDESTVREHAEAHGQAMAGGDLNRAAQDLTDDARAQAGPVMKSLPRPITGAEILDVRTDADEVVVNILYSGADSKATVESRWAEVDGKPMIVGLQSV
jgi:hypothetical protein